MKMTKIVLAIILSLIISIPFSANVLSISEIDYENEGISVIFDANSVLSSEKKQLIADKLIYGDNLVEEGISTYSWCWLLGHDIVSESVTVVEHKVNVEIPRCIENIYAIETCNKCDYMERTLLSSAPLMCCPEE